MLAERAWRWASTESTYARLEVVSRRRSQGSAERSAGRREPRWWSEATDGIGTGHDLGTSRTMFLPGQDAGPDTGAAFERKVASLAAVIDEQAPDVLNAAGGRTRRRA